MEIGNSKFICSNTDWRKCPEPKLPEYAFIGRSNVGKSSLINMLCGNKGLAKVSGRPGKTQLINHFLIDECWYMADLPGYGYAKVSKKQRSQFQNFTLEYLACRVNLMCVFILIDARLEPQKIDLDFMANCGKKEIPFCMVFTKSDKLSKNEINRNLANYQKVMLKTWAEMPTFYITSAETGLGKDELLAFVNETNLLFN